MHVDCDDCILASCTNMRVSSENELAALGKTIST